MALIYFLVERPCLLRSRASALDRETATMMGIDFRKIILLSFSLDQRWADWQGSCRIKLHPPYIFTLGWGYGLKAFTAVI